MSEGRLLSVDYEVFGKVQGVFFRKYTQQTAKQQGLVGWVQNTRRGTVIGQVQGPNAKIQFMKEWLRKTGSPHSRIERCVIKNERAIEKQDHKEFVVIK